MRDCPFCGTAGQAGVDLAAIGFGYCVNCDACGASGPARVVAALAIESWDTRPPAQLPLYNFETVGALADEAGGV
jgi:hypothetical protein